MIFSALTIVLAVAVSGCNMVQVNEEKDRKIVVAKVNGTEILKGEFLDQYEQYVSYYGVSEEDEEQVKSVKTDILDNLVRQELVRQKAETAGHEVNDEIRTQAEKEFEQSVKEYAKSLQENAEKNTDKDAYKDTDYESQARTKMEESLKSMDMTKEQYIEFLAENIVVQNYVDELTTDLKVEDKEIEDYYNEELSFQKENPSLASYYSSVQIVTEPASRRVKHILIKLADEDTEAIDKLRQDSKDDEADKLREEKLKAIKTKADEVLAKVKAGEDFETLLKEYGEDPGMKSEENKDGYTMVRDASMRPEFLEASFQLKKGETSDLVATDNGYHIIKVYDATEDVIAPLDDKKEEIKTALLSQKKNEKTNELIEQWIKEADIKKYDNRL